MHLYILVCVYVYMHVNRIYADMCFSDLGWLDLLTAPRNKRLWLRLPFATETIHTQTTGRIQKVNFSYGSIIYTIGVLEPRIG